MVRHPAVVIFVFLLLVVKPSDAVIWSVEKDGSGDFSVIQDAVDTAADGDTLMIGPGRFDDYRRHTLGSWVDRLFHVLLNGRSLTMIGSGQGVTVIGPEVEYPIIEHDKGIVLVHGAELYLSDLTIEHCYGAIDCWDTSYLEVERCTFQHHTWGVGCGVFSSRGARIFDCSFLNYHRGIFAGSGSVSTVVVRCEFRVMVFGMTTAATQELIVRDGIFSESHIGIQLSSDSSATIENVDIESDRMSLVLKSGSFAELLNSTLTGSDLTTVWVDGLSSLTGSGNILRGIGFPSLRIYRSDVALSDCHILTTTGYAVECEPNFPADWTLDLRNNWWGVSDADSIAALIYDGHDSPDIDILVDYLPFRDEQVSNEPMGWGELKRLYR